MANLRQPYFLSVIVPVYNEADYLVKTYQILSKYFSQKSFKVEYVFINDGSTDGSSEILSSLKKKDPKISVLNNFKNRGKGEAIKKGVLSARGKYVFFTDADFSTPISEFEKILPQLNKYDIVIGSRRIRGSRVVRPQSLRRRFFGIVFYLILDIFFRLPVRDTNCGFKCFKTKEAKKIFSRQKIKGWGFDAETFYIAKIWKLSVKEVPIVWYDRPGSKVKILKAAAETLKELWQIKTNASKGIYNK